MPLRLFVLHPSALLTDHRPHGDGLVAHGFIRELAARGHELHVAAEGVDLLEPLPPNVHLHVLGKGTGPAPIDRIGFMRRARRLYRRLARTARFDLIHQLNPVDVGLTLGLADAGLPVVLGPYVPEWPGFRKPGGAIARPLVVRLNAVVRAAQQRRASAVLLSTPAAATKLAPGVERRLRVHHLSGGIDDRAWAPAPAGREGNPPEVLFLANLTVRKGILVLLEAFEEVARTISPARLVVAGDGPLRDEVEGRVRATPDPGRVELVGAVDRPRAIEVMQRCAVYCSPSLGEPFGMTALEAMACAKPVVATDAGGLSYLVPDDGGRKVPPGDAAALAAALCELLAAPELRHEMGRHNRRTVEERYAWPRVVDRLESIYAEVVWTRP